MATENDTRHDDERHLAVRALCQIRALVPLAQKLADQCEDPLDDALLGLLGRIDGLNHAAIALLEGLEPESVGSLRTEILGAPEVHG